MLAVTEVEGMVFTRKISLKTLGNADTLDITEAVARAVAESGLASGTVTVFCPGATSGLLSAAKGSGPSGVAPGHGRGAKGCGGIRLVQDEA